MEFIIILEVLVLLFFLLFLSVILFFRKRLAWIFISGGFFAASAFVLIYILLIIFSTYRVGLSDEQLKVVKIKKGSNFSEISRILYNDGIIDSPSGFLWISKLLGFEKKLKAGKYEIPEEISYYSLLMLLSSGKSVQEKVTIPEGLRTERVAFILSEKLGIDKERFIELVNDKEFVKSFGLDTISLEGYLLPETYNFYWLMNEEEVIATFIREFKKILADSVMAKISESEYTLREYVILASIIEGEAKYDEERNLVSAVFHNRLKKKARLQADPTIQYIIDDGPRRLLKKDLEIDSSYNTYLYGGLPPGPICNPGGKSILAAIYPAKGDYFYFVAKGDGYHAFSKTQREHLRAKRKLDKLRIELRKSQKNN
ncbi:endolytic transglycosylase MltG [candidate division KSB1 bacterium]